jgi:hypothetical protein
MEYIFNIPKQFTSKTTDSHGNLKRNRFSAVTLTAPNGFNLHIAQPPHADKQEKRPHCVRNVHDTPEKMALRIQHDLWYVQNWSLWLDLRILLMTPLVLVHRNAY